MQTAASELILNIISHSVGGKGTRRDNGNLTFLYRRDLGGHDLDVLVVFDLFGNIAGEKGAVNGKCRARGHTCGVSRLHNERAEASQLLLEKSYGVGHTVRTKGVGANQLRKVGRVMGGGVLFGLHLKKTNLDTALGDLPSRLTARKTRTVNVNDILHSYSFWAKARIIPPRSPLPRSVLPFAYSRIRPCDKPA